MDKDFAEKLDKALNTINNNKAFGHLNINDKDIDYRHLVYLRNKDFIHMQDNNKPEVIAHLTPKGEEQLKSGGFIYEYVTKVNLADNAILANKANKRTIKSYWVAFISSIIIIILTILLGFKDELLRFIK